jgi:hypothetical protein
LSWTSFIRAAASTETDRVKAQVRAAIRSLVLMVVAGILLVIGLVFALTGTYASLSERIPSWQAGALVALVALAVCLLLMLLARRSGRRPTPPRPVRPQRPTAEDLEATAELGAAASTAAREFVRRHRPSGLQLTLAALVAGLVASRRSRRREP